jgi:hypothetical protein
MPNFTDAKGAMDYIQLENPTAADLQRKLGDSGWEVETAKGKPDNYRKRRGLPPGQGGGTVWTNPTADAEVRIMSHKKAVATGNYLERRVIVKQKTKGGWHALDAEGEQPQPPKGLKGKAAKAYVRIKTHHILERVPITVSARIPAAKDVRRGMHYGYPVKRPVD